MMLLLKCRKGQSLEKVEKLCRTANADKKFPTHINNSHHTFATRKTALQFRCTCACLARSREKKSRESDSERTRDSGFVASTGVRQRLQFSNRHLRCPPQQAAGRRPGCNSGVVHPSSLGQLAPPATNGFAVGARG